MSASTRKKNKRSLTVAAGFPASAGSSAYDNSGNLNASAVAFDFSTMMPGAFSYSAPLPSIVDPLVRGEFQTDGSPLEVDDQPMSGSFPVYLRELTDAAQAVLHDIIHGTGYADANLNSTISNSPRLCFDLKATMENPHDATDTHWMVFRDAYITSVEGDLGSDEANQITINWTCRRTKLTDNDVG